MWADFDQVSCSRALWQMWPCICSSAQILQNSCPIDSSVTIPQYGMRSWCLVMSDTGRNVICSSQFPSALLKYLSLLWKSVLLYPDDTLPLKTIIFLTSKRKAEVLNMYIFVNIYVLRIWIFSCLQCWNISYVEGWFFFLDVMFMKWNLSLIPQQTKGWFVHKFVLSPPHMALEMWDLTACLWCLTTCRWSECFKAFVFRVKHGEFSFKEYVQFIKLKHSTICGCKTQPENYKKF